MNRRSVFSFTALFALSFLVASAGAAQHVDVRRPDGFGISPPMSQFPQDTSRPSGPPRETFEPGRTPWLGGEPAGILDPLLPRGKAPMLPLVATDGLTSFDGVGVPNYTSPWVPPDTNGDISPNWYVMYVNTDWGVFDRSGVLQAGFPKAGNSFWASWAGDPNAAKSNCASRNDGDPVVKYDRAADRWVVTQFAVPNRNGPDYECIAVSQTNDPRGSWYLYAYQLAYFNDYPKLSVWPDSYYITYDMWTASFQGAAICAYDRASMLAGVPTAAQQCTQLAATYGSVLVGDWNGATAPPAGAAAYAVDFSTSNALNVWRSAVTWGGTPTMTVSSAHTVSVASFTLTCAGGYCVPQPGTKTQLDSLGDRVMFRMAYRNFGDHEALVVSHSVDPSGLGNPTGPNKGKNASGVRWYELRNTPPDTTGTATPTLFQQGTFAPDYVAGNTGQNFRWMPSIAIDKTGDIAVGYSLSNDGTVGTVHYPSVYITGRVPGDAAGTMRAETAAFEAAASQTGANRWGDYAAMQIDPVDDCTFWFTTEYIKPGGANWSTRVASFRIVPDAPASLTATPGPNQIALSWPAVPGALSYTVLRASGACPGSGFTPLASGVTATAYTDTTAAAGSTYAYQVRTVACATSVSSACASATALCAAPGAPALASATGTCTSADLAWSAGSGTTAAYNVYRAAGGCPAGALTKIAGPLTATTYSDTTAVAGTAYAYVVRGTCDAAGLSESPDSNCLSATRILDTTAPVVTAPTAVTIDQSICCGVFGGATGASSAPLAAFLAGGSATDNCGTPTRLTPRVAGVDVTAATCFEVGATSVTFRYQDGQGNVGTASSSATIRMFGDLNLDGIVDPTDMVILRAYLNFAATPGTPPFNAPLGMADLNHDTVVDPTDSVIFRAYLNFVVTCLAP